MIPTAAKRLPLFMVWPLAVALIGTDARAGAPSFRNEVMAVLSRAGCNQGVCHGNQNGKNGFKLSLRGDDPDFDFRSLTHDMLGRRVDPLRPQESLLLQKAAALVPHEGGRRFSVDSPEYELLCRWIAHGLPADPPAAPRLESITVTPAEQVMVEPIRQIQLRVTARLSDGQTRDVTRLAVFEPSGQTVRVTPDGLVQRQQFGESAILVRYLHGRATAQLAFVPARPGFRWPDVPATNDIDCHVFAKLRTLRIRPSELCSDSVFLRRAYLDAAGILPTADEARAFLADTRPDKRARLIDRLLQRPEFADFWALKWSDLLRNEEKTLDAKGVQAFHHWIRDAIAASRPLNEFARELIAARGSTYSHPAANYYRALRDTQTRAEAMAQVFLGIRLQCARCHNHPFDRWTQDDYCGLAAFFARVQYREIDTTRTDRLDKHEFIGEQVVWQDHEGEEKHPKTGTPVRPRFLGEIAPPDADADRLQALANWVARPENPFFARAQVNRVWYHLFGRGIVEPNDDFRASNPPANGPLLEALTRDFIDHHFDLRYLVGMIMNSRTYQLSAVPNETNQDDDSHFARFPIRPLAAEPLLDALAQVTGVPVKFNGYPLGIRAGQLPALRAVRRRSGSATPAELFLKQFGKPERLLSCECERSDDTTLGQAFQLISGEMLNRMLTEPDNRLGRLLAAGKADAEILDELCLAALCRHPSDAETKAALAVVAKAKDRRAALEDVLWGILNAKEFLLRR
jgi:hypothetical protein